MLNPQENDLNWFFPNTSGRLDKFPTIPTHQTLVRQTITLDTEGKAANEGLQPAELLRRFRPSLALLETAGLRLPHYSFVYDSTDPLTKFGRTRLMMEVEIVKGIALSKAVKPLTEPPLDAQLIYQTFLLKTVPSLFCYLQLVLEQQTTFMNDVFALRQFVYGHPQSSIKPDVYLIDLEYQVSYPDEYNYYAEIGNAFAEIVEDYAVLTAVIAEPGFYVQHAQQLDKIESLAQSIISLALKSKNIATSQRKSPAFPHDLETNLEILQNERANHQARWG